MIAVILVLALIEADRFIIDRYRVEAYQHVSDELRNVERQLTLNLFNSIQAVNLLPTLINLNPFLSQQAFALTAGHMLGEHNQLRNIVAAPDLIIRYVYPLQGNEAVMNLDYRTQPLQLASVLKAKELRTELLAGPVDLVQGGVGFIVRIPVFITDAQGQESFWGVVGAVIDTQLLYQKSGLFDADLAIDIAIRGKDGLGKDGDTFFGDPTLFEPKNIHAVISVPNGSWQIVARPAGGWRSLPDDIWKTRAFIFAIALALFFMLFAFLKALMNATVANLKFKNLLESSPVPYALVNDKQQFTFLNSAFIKSYGYTIEDIPSLSDWWIKAYPDPIEREKTKLVWDAYFKRFKSSDELLVPLETTIQSKQGSIHTVLVSLAENVAIKRFEHSVIMYDITDRKQIESKLIEAEERLQLSQSSGGIGTWEIDLISDKWIISDTITQQLGFQYAEEPNRESFLNSIHPDDRERVLNHGTMQITEKNILEIEYRIIDTLGKTRWMRSAGKVEFDANNNPVKIRGTVQEITVQKLAAEKLQLSSRVFNDTKEGIFITDSNKIIIDVNPAFCEITGYSLEESIVLHPYILGFDKQSPQFYSEMWQHINEHGHWQGEVWNHTKTGELYAELLNISTIFDDNGKVSNYVGVFTDITESKQQQEQLSLMAHYDVLTQLPNRSLFADRFIQATAHSHRTGFQLAVCFLDLDKFKPINDNYGHEVGDYLLKEVANRIKYTIREDDTVSRQGGDEFAILLGEIESITHCEQLIVRLLKRLSTPYVIDGISHEISASCGITLFPTDHADLDTLLRHADQAMYQAKQAGRNCYRIFNLEHDELISQQQHRYHEIEQALRNNELRLYYQPKVDMLTGDVFGVEALLRWIHPEKGIIPPLDFLPVIDGTELEFKIGAWVINQALRQQEVWRANDIKLEVSVNISSHHLQSAGFLAQLDAALNRFPTVEPRSLELEILESSALGDLNAIGDIIRACRDGLGVNVALDDFGTGYSSLTHLRNLPVNVIKIDQSFVRDMLDDPSDYNIIEGVIGLAQAFNRSVIAEGVETREHGLMLLIMGCEKAQGYGIARPMQADDVPAWLKSYILNPEWLSYGDKIWSDKEKKSYLFKLFIARWMMRFAENIKMQPEDITQWPIINGKQDQCNQWITREKQAKLFDREDLLRLEAAHDHFHNIAQSLLQKYQEHDLEAAREGLSELQIAFDGMEHALQLCIK